MKTVYFVRHGESVANAEGWLAGSRIDAPLTDAGREQAKASAHVLGTTKIDTIVSSPMIRAYETAQIIAKEIGYTGDILKNPLWIERDFGDVTGKKRELGFKALDAGTVMGVEQFAALHARIVQAFTSLRTVPGEHILVVSHAGVGRMVKVVAEKGEPHHFMQHDRLDNAGMYTFTLE
jgi:uncharacterized phosphatase